MRAHFYDIDTILVADSKVWIVNRANPNTPIVKINQSEFNLIKNGIYKGHNSKLTIGGKSYFLTTELLELIKIKCKTFKCDISNLIFSMQEFINKDVIENIDYDINISNILHLKNTDDHIYFICSKNNKSNYEMMIKKVENKLEENGLVIKNYYYISETFYNRNEDQISHKKVRLLLQHLIGLKTDGDKFTDEKIESYNELYFYDDELGAIDLAIDSNKVLQIILSNTEPSIKSGIKDIIKSGDHILYVNEVSPNKVNRFKTTKVDLQWSNLIKAFEKFNWKK